MQGPDGKPVTVTMGSYGIGVSRAVAAIAEATCDAIGLCWPREVAPADVHVVIAGKPGAEQWPAAEALAAEMEAAGLRVLLDDRDSVSPGVKFKDAELLGIPTIVVVGRGLADGVVEVKDRRTGEREDVALADVVAHLVAEPDLSVQKRPDRAGSEADIGRGRQPYFRRPWSMTTRSPTEVVNTASPSPVSHALTVSASPGMTGDAKRASMWWNVAGSLSHSRCSRPRPVKP